MAEALIEFSIDMSQINKLAEACPQMAPAIAEEMTRAMEESGMVLDTMVVARTPVNYGILRSSITWPAGFEMQGGGALIDTLRGIVGASDMASASGVSTVAYSEYVEMGTPAHWPPIEPLKLWAIRKLGDERIAYAVQRKIAASGTEGAHMFQRAWEEGGADQVRRIWETVAVKAIQRFEELAQ